jgi:arginyl-tRNA synthetase
VKFRETIRDGFLDAIGRVGYEQPVALALEKPRVTEHGDIATPVALSLAKSLKENPMEIAEKIAAAAVFPADVVASIEVAKPGYINLRLAPEVLMNNLLEIKAAKDKYGSAEIGMGRKCQVEYVSANPTGPLVIVSARAAAVGSVIVDLLRFVGYDVQGEYYVNDYGKQVDALGESLRFRVRERLRKVKPGEEIGAYPGAYLKEIAERIPPEDAKRWDDDEDKACGRFGHFATSALLEMIREDLNSFGVHFDNFFLESSLHPEKVKEALEVIKKSGVVYEKDGAQFFETSKLGDEKDRVLLKSGGNPTYFLGDIAYHIDKFTRGYEWVIDILGPDHHGHIPRMKAAASVIGAGDSWLEILLVGWVRLLEGQKPISMSKRAGEFITMRELIDDVGSDVAKYFFLIRRSNSPLDFDLELARKQSDENPVYYVQYAHARISSVIRFARESGKHIARKDLDLSVLSAGEERALMLHLLYFPYVVEGAAETREPHRLTVYAKDLATLFHQFYHAHRIITDDDRLSAARMVLAESTGQVLKNLLRLMGVSAPQSM